MFKSEAKITLNSSPQERINMEQANNNNPMSSGGMQGGGGGGNGGNGGNIGGGGGGGGAPFFPMGGGMMLGDSGIADEFLKLQQDFFKWQQQLLQNQQVLHSRVAPLATNPPQLQSVGVIRDILGQTPQGPPNGPPSGAPPPQDMAEALNPGVGMGMGGVGVRRGPVERIINIRFEDGPTETDETELHGPAFSRTGPAHDISRDFTHMGIGGNQTYMQPTGPPTMSVSMGAFPPSQQPQSTATPQQRGVSPRPQGPRGYSRPMDAAPQGQTTPAPTPAAPPTSFSSAAPSVAQQQYQALPPEQKQQFAQFMQQQRQQPTTWPPQQQQQQQRPGYYQPSQQTQQATWPPKQPSPQPQAQQAQQQATWVPKQPSPQPQQATWPPKQPSPQPQQSQPPQQAQQATWPPKQPSPQPQPPQQATWPPKQPSPQPGTAPLQQQSQQQPDSTAFWKELEDKRQNLGLQEEEGGEGEPARPPRRGSRQDTPPQDASRPPQYSYNGETTAAAPPGVTAGPRYTSVVTVAADQPQEPGRDKVRSVVQLNAEPHPAQPQGQQRAAPVVRGFAQPGEEALQSRIINQAAGRSRSSVSPPSTANSTEAQQGGRVAPSATSTAATTPPRTSPTQNFPGTQLRPMQNRVSPPVEAPQPAPPAPPAAGPPPPPPPAPPMAPPPPPAPSMPQGERRTASGKKIVTCKGGPELDAREELMMAIRGHGGMKALRKTHPPF